MSTTHRASPSGPAYNEKVTVAADYNDVTTLTTKAATFAVPGLTLLDTVIATMKSALGGDLLVGTPIVLTAGEVQIDLMALGGNETVATITYDLVITKFAAA